MTAPTRLHDGRGWLLRDGERVAPLEVAASYGARRRGLLGRDGIDGAMLISPCPSVHTFSMRFDIDVAYLDRTFTVLDVVAMPRNRLGGIRLRARHTVEAAPGSFARWGIGAGTTLDVEYAG